MRTDETVYTNVKSYLKLSVGNWKSQLISSLSEHLYIEVNNNLRAPFTSFISLKSD